MDEREARITRAFEALRDAEASKQALAALPDALRPRDLAEAYAIQDRFAAALGRPVGYKVAYINPAVQRALGIPSPMFGRLIEGRVFDSPGRLRGDGYFHRLVETEFAFRMARPLPPRATPYAQDEVVGAVATLVPCFEIADTRFADWKTVAPLDATADNALGSAWVGGAPCADFRGLDLAAHEVVSSVNGREASRGTGANVGGSPLASLTWLANELGRWGRGLATGDVVTTGCCMDVLPLRPGDVAEADFGALGRVRVEFTT
jgi:2-keto-4-pentenoate hydratase